ncbi:protein of unknown function [Streptomyces murinus]
MKRYTRFTAPGVEAIVAAQRDPNSRLRGAIAAVDCTYEASPGTCGASPPRTARSSRPTSRPSRTG